MGPDAGSDQDLKDQSELLKFVSDLARLAREGGASRIEVEADEFSVSVGVEPKPRSLEHAVVQSMPAAAAEQRVERVLAAAVGIFSSVREWTVGDRVELGADLGAIQSLGHMAEIKAPVAGQIAEMLVSGGSPVEYGQTLFVIYPAQ